jgi:hypothetical protein
LPRATLVGGALTSPEQREWDRGAQLFAPDRSTLSITSAVTPYFAARAFGLEPSTFSFRM